MNLTSCGLNLTSHTITYFISRDSQNFGRKTNKVPLRVTKYYHWNWSILILLSISFVNLLALFVGRNWRSRRPFLLCLFSSLLVIYLQVRYLHPDVLHSSLWRNWTNRGELYAFVFFESPVEFDNLALLFDRNCDWASS